MASQLPTLSKIRPPNAGRSPSNQPGTVPRSASPGTTGIAVKLPGKSGILPPGTGIPARTAGVSPSTGIPSKSAGISPGIGIPSVSSGVSPSTGIPSKSAGILPGTGIPSVSSGASPSTGIPSKSAGISPGTGIPSKNAPSGIPSKAPGIIPPAGTKCTPGDLTGSCVSFSVSATGIVPDSVSTTNITKSQSSAVPELTGNPQEPGIPEALGIPPTLNDTRAPSYLVTTSKSLSEIPGYTQPLEPISERLSKSETEVSSVEAEVEEIENETDLVDNESESLNEDSNMADRTVAIGDRVTISGVKNGIVRYFGRVHFAEGYWCGVELSEPDGKHNGLIEGVMYFNVPDNCGIFAPLERVQLAPLGGDVPEASPRTSGVPKSKLPALKTRTEGRLSHETSPGLEIPVPVKSKLPKFSAKSSPRSDPSDPNLRPSKLPGLPKRTPTTPDETKIPMLPMKNLNRTFVKGELNETYTMSNVPDLLTPSPASAGNMGQLQASESTNSDAGQCTTIGLEESLETVCPLDLPSCQEILDTSVELPPQARLATSTPLVKRSKSDLDSGLSESEDLAEESPTGNAGMNSQRPLNPAMTFDENRGRPLSIISTSSIDTGYQPDTDSEMGTLTVNSPSDEPLHSNGPSGDYGHDGNQTVGHSNELQQAYIATFKDYQRGLREGMARDQQRQLAGESDTDMYVSDAPTMLPDSEADKDFSDDDISKDSLAEDIMSTERTDSDDDIDLDSINIPELLSPNSGLAFPTMPSPTTPKNLLPSNGDLTLATDSSGTTATSETVTKATNGLLATSPSPCDSLDPDTAPVAMETSQTESELQHEVSMETIVKESQGLTDLADLTLVDGSMNETPDNKKILNFTIDLDDPILAGDALKSSVEMSPPMMMVAEDGDGAVRDEGHAEVTEFRLPSRETSLVRDDGVVGSSVVEDTHSSGLDTHVSTHDSAHDGVDVIPSLDSETTSPPKINVTLDDVEKIIDATIPLDRGDVTGDVTHDASDVSNLHATYDVNKTDPSDSQDNSLAENRSSKESTPTTESASDPKSKISVKKPVVKKIPNIEHKKPNLSKVRSSLADYINTPPPKPKPKPKPLPPPPPPKKKVESKSPTPERQRSNSITKVEVEKEFPKVKRTTPKSKWDSIMTNIKTNKTVPPKPKTEVKSKLFEPTVASAASQPKVSKIEKLNMKNDAKNLQNRRLSLDSGKSRLAVGGQRKMSLRSGEEELGMSSERSSRTDLRPIGEESSKSDKPLNRSASSLRRAGSPSSQSIKSETQLSVSAASQISTQSSRVGKLTGTKGAVTDRRTSLSGRTGPATATKPPARRTSLVAKKVADAKKTTEAPKIEPAKKPPSKPPVSQIKGHQPDLVSNSIGSRAHAAQEIIRLEALCEARTKELTFAKMQIKTASQGFDAMSVIVQYLSHEMNAFQSPELNKRLINAEKKIVGLLADLDELRGEKSRIESTMHDLIQSHKDATEAMRNDHRAQMGHVEERVCKRYDEDLQKVVDQHTEEVKTLKSYHEKRFNELEDRSERHSEDTRKKHTRQLNDLAESDERHLSELQKQHEIKLEEITKRFEEIKCVLHDKVYTLKAECDELRNRSQMYEEALQRDTDFQLQLALAPYRDLPQEIDSLRTVVEMRNAEIHELRQSKVELERQLEELPHARERIISLEQKIENLEAIVTMKQDYEKQLVEKHQHLLRRFDKEFKANKRLSMDNEELMYRLNETEDLLLSPSPERTGASPVTTPDILARRGFCRSPHDTASVTRRQRTSSTSSSDDKRSSTISMRSEDEKGS